MLLVARGYTHKEVAADVVASTRSIARWCRAYLQRHRIEDLYDAEQPGRPLSAPTITLPRILQELEHNPMNVGYASTIWTVPMLAHRLSKKYRCRITPRTLRRRMKEAGLVWKRPRYVYHQRADYIGAKKGA